MSLYCCINFVCELHMVQEHFSAVLVLNPIVCSWHVETTGLKSPSVSTHVTEFPLRFLKACLMFQNFSHSLYSYFSTTLLSSEFLTLLKYSYFVKFASTFLRGYLYTQG